MRATRAVRIFHRPMDALAYLRKQGWRGSGHSLDGADRGLKRPLLISHKQDQLGLGKRKAAHTADDQWWLRAYDETLANIGSGSGKESTLSQVQKKGITRGGLYGHFVRGEGLAGTVGNKNKRASPYLSVGEMFSADELEDAADLARRNSKRKREDDVVVAASKKVREEEEEDGNMNTSAFASLLNVPPSDVATSEISPSDALPPDALPPDALPTDALPPDKLPSNEPPPYDPLRKSILGFQPDDIDLIEAVLAVVKQKVKSEIEANLQKGLYGAYVSPKAEERMKKGTLVDHPTVPGKKLPYKAAKIARHSAMRRAKETARRKMITDLILEDHLPNPWKFTPAQLMDDQNWWKIDRAFREVLRFDKRRIQKERAKARGVLEKAAINERRIAREERAARKQAREAEKHFQLALALTAEEKKVAAKLAKLSAEEKEKYVARAAEKNQTLNAYVTRRLSKQAARRATRKEQKAAAEAKAYPQSIVDTTGEPKTDPLSVLESGPDPDVYSIEYTPLADGSCPRDPSLWENRIVKFLPKEVREARRLWRKERRDHRKLLDGKAYVDRKSRKKVKVGKTQKLMGDILREEGVVKGASQDQQARAKRKARKVLKMRKRGELVAMEKAKEKWAVAGATAVVA